MKQPIEPRWEEQIERVARTFVYPPTPELTETVRQRLAAKSSAPHQRLRLRPAWALGLAFILLLIGLLATPPVRAVLQEWLQIGAVRIWLVEPPPTRQGVPTPHPAPTPITSLFDLAGATTLTEARGKAGFPIRLPAYPADLGDPDGVFFQELGGPAIILVWLDPAQPTQAKLSLHILGPNTFVEKGNATRLEQTTVNGQPAFWTEGPYMLAYHRGSNVDWDVRRLVEGHVLIWTEGALTYRLETQWTMTEAVRVAESLVALPPADLNFSGKTTLAQAQTQVEFPLRLPAYPADLGAPDHVFVQETNGHFVVLIWMEPAKPQQVRLLLYEVGPGVGLQKGAPPVLRTTRVKDSPAVWIEGIHYLQHRVTGWNSLRIINQDVLVWSEIVDGQTITYRLETTLSEAEAIQIAESLR